MKYLLITVSPLLLLLTSCTSYKNFDDIDTLPTQTIVHENSHNKQILAAKKYLITIPNKIQVPSFSVAVGIDGKLVWSEAIGYEDIENKIPATPNSIYRIGSTSKAVTSTLTARLFEQNKINLDKDISNDIDNYPNKSWGFTPRQLLSHTAGIPDYEDLNLLGIYRTLCNCKNYTSVSEALDIFNTVELLFKPGTNYKYTSLDFVLLSQYLETITQSDFLSLLNNEIVTPLGMTNTFADNSIYQQKKTAMFYETKNNTYKPWPAFGLFNNKIDLSYKWAGGGLFSTPTDLVKMGNAILANDEFLSKNTKATFFTPQKLTNGQANPQHYALGWRSDHKYKHEQFKSDVWIVHHGGVSKGAMNLLILFPNHKLVVNASINTRTENFGVFWHEVMMLASYFIDDQTKAH